jgi:hypothetical protein
MMNGVSRRCHSLVPSIRFPGILSAMRILHQPQRVLTFSEQYRKAWAATFPLGAYPQGDFIQVSP